MGRTRAGRSRWLCFLVFDVFESPTRMLETILDDSHYCIRIVGRKDGFHCVYNASKMNGTVSKKVPNGREGSVLSSPTARDEHRIPFSSPTSSVKNGSILRQQSPKSGLVLYQCQALVCRIVRLRQDLRSIECARMYASLHASCKRRAASSLLVS